MQADFWHERWRDNKIGFHETQANQLLTNNFAQLPLNAGGRIFLPLCGKTLDIGWLLANGYKVAGAELSQLAIEQLFDQLNLTPTIVTHGELKQYSADNIDMFVGDIFNISTDLLGKIDAIYDRAALVALPEQMRPKYAQHLMQICQNAPQLLICFEYDQSLMNGPPFSVSKKEVHQHYANHYNIKLLQAAPASKSFPGKQSAAENIWLLNLR